MTTTELNLHVPLGNEAREVDWSELYGEDMDGFTWWETFEYEADDTHTFTFVASNGSMVGAYVNGDYYAREDIEDHDADDYHPSYDWDALRDALNQFEQSSGPAEWGAEGPMMNYFWPVSTDGNGAEWAGKLTDLPLCAVLMPGGEMGVALTGGGMDLSWEIGAAYVALGYYPPTSLRLPAMAGLDASKEPNRTTARALLQALRNQAWRLNHTADHMIVEFPGAFTD